MIANADVYAPDDAATDPAGLQMLRTTTDVNSYHPERAPGAQVRPPMSTTVTLAIIGAAIFLFARFHR